MDHAKSSICMKLELLLLLLLLLLKSLSAQSWAGKTVPEAMKTW